MKLTAKMPILYRAHLYDVVDELPAMDQIMVQAWLEAGSAEWKEDKKTGSACGTACVASDKPAACGSACGAGDKPEEKPAACGAADK